MTKKDHVILDLLKHDAKLSTREMSEKTGISMTTVHNRIKKLEREGVIRGYMAVIDKKKLKKKRIKKVW